MKGLRSQLVCFGALCLLLLAIVLALVFAPPADSAEETTSQLVTNYNVGLIQAVAIKNSAGSAGLIFDPSTGEIAVLDAPETSFSQEKLTAFVYNAAHLPARLLIENPGDAAEYGLAQPAAQISLILSNGETVRLRIGDESPVGAGRYLQREDSGEIYLIDSVSASLLLQSVQDFRILDLFPALTAETIGRVGRIVVSGQEGGFVVERQQGATLYAMREPVQAGLDWQTTYDRLISPLLSLKPVRFVAEHDALADYGLDQPAYRLSLTIDRKNYESLFSPKDADTWYCVSLPDGPVCELPADLVSFLSGDYLSLLGDSLYSRNLTDIARITASRDNQSFSVEVEGEGENLSAKIGGRVADNRELTTFYTQATSIPIAGALEEEAKISGQPVLTLLISLRAGGADLVEFFPLDERRYCVSVNGQTTFSTYQTAAEDIWKSFVRFCG